MHFTRVPFSPCRPAAIGLATAATVLLISLTAPSPARAATTCTWGGTALAPTGWFTVKPGVTAAPMPTAGRFVATGRLGGSDPRCSGRMTWTGQVDAGSTCAVASFEGAVEGLPGVARFWGKGSLLVPSQLYDKAGNVVGVENANILTQHNSSLTASCTTPAGFTGPADFSSVVELYR